MNDNIKKLKEVGIDIENLPLSALKWNISILQKQTVKRRFSKTVNGQILNVVYAGKPIL